MRTKDADGAPTKYGRRIAVTMPDYLFDWVKREALDNNRSISSQITFMLESYVPVKERKIIEREGIEW